MGKESRRISRSLFCADLADLRVCSEPADSNTLPREKQQRDEHEQRQSYVRPPSPSPIHSCSLGRESQEEEEGLCVLFKRAQGGSSDPLPSPSPRLLLSIRAAFADPSSPWLLFWIRTV